ncbi:hypothetical protein OS190_01430 [Sulfitobacter sp. F26204]|uniref:hypothetical protein n=1 Tax=Sulfitobacter sp. F26204 TaxID=2996014 RepID=UPI00225E6055|nr:hypothetical protein [Sulfitobacter sp. F26204]MCX7558210.1 hypothetical protein [Sulfitobacter sp. F26204]
MAKAKKPASGNKNTSGASKNESVKAKDASAEVKPEVVSKADVNSGDTPAKPATTSKPESTATASSIPKTAKTEPMKQSDPVKKSDASPTEDAKPAAVSVKPKDTVKANGDSPTSGEVKSETRKPVPTTTSQSHAALPAKTQKEGSHFWPLLFGGVIAGGIGFFVAEMDLMNRSGDTVEIETMLAAQADRIATLEAAEPQTVEAQGLDEVKESISAMDAMMTALEARLSELENRPVLSGEGTGPTSEYEAGLAALKTSVEEQKAEISRLLENALSVEEATANAAQAAAAQAALTTITTALATGAGFAPAIETLNANGISDVPAALTENAEGVTTLLSLQTSFPDAARAALSAARATGAEDDGGGVAAFLKRQLGARSVAPREGSDPDAVLSRAEATVRRGNIEDALTELETLPVPAQDAMADWLVAARARTAAETAVQDLSQRLSAN